MNFSNPFHLLFLDVYRCNLTPRRLVKVCIVRSSTCVDQSIKEETFSSVFRVQSGGLSRSTLNASCISSSIRAQGPLFLEYSPSSRGTRDPELGILTRYNLRSTVQWLGAIVPVQALSSILFCIVGGVQYVESTGFQGVYPHFI